MEDKIEEYEYQKKRIIERIDEIDYYSKKISNRKDEYALQSDKMIGDTEDVMTYVKLSPRERAVYQKACEEMRSAKYKNCLMFEAAEEEYLLEKRKCENDISDLDYMIKEEQDKDENGEKEEE